VSSCSWLGAFGCCVIAACGSAAGGNSATDGKVSASGAPGGGTSGTHASAGASTDAGASVSGGRETAGGGSPAASAGSPADPSPGGAMASGGANGAEPLPCSQLAASIAAYRAAHPGNGGKDWDINAKTPAELAADPDAQRLLAVCGPHQRPVIPVLAWEYGGADHAWIHPEQSALAYCVYTPVSPDSSGCVVLITPCVAIWTMR